MGGGNAGSGEARASQLLSIFSQPSPNYPFPGGASGGGHYEGQQQSSMPLQQQQPGGGGDQSLLHLMLAGSVPSSLAPFSVPTCLGINHLPLSCSLLSGWHPLLPISRSITNSFRSPSPNPKLLLPLPPPSLLLLLLSSKQRLRMTSTWLLLLFPLPPLSPNSRLFPKTNRCPLNSPPSSTSSRLLMPSLLPRKNRRHRFELRRLFPQPPLVLLLPSPEPLLPLEFKFRLMTTRPLEDWPPLSRSSSHQPSPRSSRGKTRTLLPLLARSTTISSVIPLRQPPNLHRTSSLPPCPPLLLPL
jgi:hypothetical protein